MEFAPLDWGAKQVDALKEFQQATTILELGAGDFSRTLALSQRYPDKIFTTSDYEFSQKALDAMDATKARPNVTVAKADAHALQFPDESFDFVFSIALMEHIPRPVDAMNEIHRILKPDGYHWFIQAPFWSCAKGHHFMHWDQSVLDTIPTFSHLYMTEEEMRQTLNSKAPDFDIEECLQRIYHREDLSRMSRDETRAVVDQCPLQLLSWTEKACNAFDEDIALKVQSKLLYSISIDEMKISGATVLQRKTPSKAPATSFSQKLRKLRTKPLAFVKDMVKKRLK